MHGRGIVKVALVCIFIHAIILTAISGLSNNLAAAEPSAVIGDSLAILDSLVNHNKVTDNKLAIEYATKSLALAQRLNSPEKLVDAYKLLGIAYFQNHKDSSFHYYSEAAKIAEESNLDKQKAIMLYNIAAIYNISGDYKNAVTFLDSSINLARVNNDFQGISNSYNLLGSIKFNIHDYENARQHFTKALEVAREHSLFEPLGAAMGNLARLEFEPDTMKSNAMSLEALNYLRKVRGTEEEMANILINIGYGFKNPDSALYYYSSALALAENAQLPLIIIGAYNNMAYSYMDKGEYSKAELCVRDFAIPIAEKYEYTDWLSSLYDTYSDVCVGQGDIKMALSMQKKALKFRVADYRKKASDKVQLLAAVLDLKNKELIIQNEEKKILIQKNQLQNMELWLAITAILVILSVFVTMFLHHRNKVKIQKEKITSARRIIEMEESEKGRIARELHDLTGQLVLGISGMIENIEFSEPGIKQLINDRIKELGGAIRHISHRMNRAMIEHFTFSELITGLCLDVQKLAGLKINLQIPDELPELPNEMVLHFYRIVQELLTNAGKYAKESPISIVIAYENESLTIHYEDQGPGFIYKEDQKTGMGLLNIFERVKLVNGKGTVHSEPGIGTKWDFSFPVNEKK